VYFAYAFTWPGLTGIQEGRINQFQQEAEIRIGQIREECRRKLEAKSTEVKRDFDKHVRFSETLWCVHAICL